MSRCKPCGATFRKGTRVLVPGRGGLVGMIVCSKCARNALVILPVGSVGASCSCGDVGTTCGKCLDKAVDKAKHEVAGTKKLAKAIRIRSKLYPREGSNAAEGERRSRDGRRKLPRRGSW